MITCAGRSRPTFQSSSGLVRPYHPSDGRQGASRADARARARRESHRRAGQSWQSRDGGDDVESRSGASCTAVRMEIVGICAKMHQTECSCCIGRTSPQAWATSSQERSGSLSASVCGAGLFEKGARTSEAGPDANLFPAPDQASRACIGWRRLECSLKPPLLLPLQPLV